MDEIDAGNDMEGFIYEDAPLNITKPDGSEEFNSEKEVYLFPLDQIVLHHGEEKAIWKAVKKVNLEIRRYSHIFLGATKIACGHTQGIPVLSPMEYPFGCIKKLVAGSTGVLASWLVGSDGKTNYMVLVNHDPYQSQTVRIETDPKYKCISMMPVFIGGEIPETPVSGPTDGTPTMDPNPGGMPDSVTLQPGGYFIWKWS